jgi:hypothetical protein
MKALANNISQVGDQGPEVGIFSSAAVDYRDDSEKNSRHLEARLAFIIGTTAVLLILRWIDGRDRRKMATISYLVWGDHGIAVHFLRDDARIAFIA